MAGRVHASKATRHLLPDEDCPYVDDDKSSSTDTEVPQPPDELELKQLKRLETMKESPA